MEYVTSICDWWPEHLPSCVGLTALRLRDCRSHEDVDEGFDATAEDATDSNVDLDPHLLPSGPYLRTLQELHLVDCQFREFPKEVSEATALRSLVCTNNAARRLPLVPSAPFEAKDAAGVLGCLPRLSELRLKASDWAAAEQHSLPEMLPDIRISFVD